MIVTKFGGSSLADASQFLKVQQILSENTDRRYVVPSAPGKRYAKDDKVTDLLYMCHAAAQRGEDFMPLLDRIRERYESIASDLEVDFDFSADFAAIADAFRGDASREYAASRGEYLNGKLLSAYLGFAFVDAADVIRFDTEGTLAEDETNRLLSRALAQHKYAVVPGFYGADELGGIHTFSRGGSDISGALVARAVNADVYENWTDVTGFRMADPRIVKDAQYIESLTYRELRELSYMGATVLHGDAVFPVRKMGIPTNIRNTNDPLHPGTMIRTSFGQESNVNTITGIAGSKGFTVISIEKDMMNAELGFGKRVLQAFEEHGLSFEHLPTGIDTMCVVIRAAELKPLMVSVLDRIQELVQPDQITVHEDLAMVATVGRGMVRTSGTAARLFTALATRGISVRIIDQGSSELSIIVGVDESQFEMAIEAIYDAFVRM